MTSTISSGPPTWPSPTTIEPDIDQADHSLETVFVLPPVRQLRFGVWNRLYLGGIKRVIDVVGSLVFLILLSPLLAAIAIWIRIDSPGTSIYHQVRIGQNGRQFTLYKFRTMTAAPSGELIWIENVGVRRHKVRNDPRVTSAGAWLRRSSLDELPQLWNVLRGDMSLVGPRPELPEIVDEYDDWQHRRHEIRPGLTGWWQISGRSDKPMHEHTELDLYYVDHASFRLDCLIVARTVGVVIRGLGAF